MWPALRPEWERFEKFVTPPNSSPSGFRPGISAPMGSACSGFSVYLDDRHLYLMPGPRVAELAEIRLIEPRSTRPIGDSLIRTGSCGALHLISLAAWAKLKDPARALDVVASLGAVTVDELDLVFETFAFAWRAEGSKEVVYHHPERKDCGEFKRPVTLAQDVLSRSQRDAMMRILQCVQPR